MTDIPSPVLELYHQRMLFFVETGPQTNEYKQILLNEQQFNHVVMTIAAQFAGHPNSAISNESYKLPDLQDIQFAPAK